MRQSDISLMFESLEEAVVLLNRHGDLILYNELFKVLMDKHSLKVDYGESLLKLLANEWRNVAEEILMTCTTSTSSTILEISLKDDDSREHYYELKIKPIFPRSNDSYRVMMQVRNVTTQKIYETKAISLAREYQSLIENANALIFGTDSRGYVTEWNHASSTVTGYSRDEVYTQKFIPLIGIENQYEPWQKVIEAVMNGKLVSSCELMIRGKFNASIALLINATPKLNATGKVVGVLFIGQDITELMTYRNVLEQKVAQRTFELENALKKEKELLQAKDRFVAMATHEFKSPISYILNVVSKLKSEHSQLGSRQLSSTYQKIEAQLKHMSAFLEDILNIEKNIEHRIKINLTETNLLSFFNTVIEDILNSTNHTHIVKFKHSLPTVARVDARILRNVLVNLLTNAIKFSPDQTSITLEAHEQMGYMVLSVTDSGTGINTEDIDKIFEPFIRGGNVTNIPGTGLGLSIVKKSVDVMGGTIVVTSEPGKGSCFKVSIPLAYSDNVNPM